MPLKPNVTIDETIAYLNELVALDAKAMTALVETRHICNEALANHPTAQVAVSGGGIASVGMLGVLNGLFGTDEDGWGPITANFDNDTLVNFTRSAPRALIKKNS